MREDVRQNLETEQKTGLNADSESSIKDENRKCDIGILVDYNVQVNSYYSGIRNVLILSLSILKMMSESVYSYDYKGIKSTVKGYYQLEPIPKMLKEYLERNNKTLDCIILLETKDTLKKETVNIDNQKCDGTYSARDIFIMAIKPYMNPSVPDSKKFYEIKFDPDKDNATADGSEYDSKIVAINKVIEYIKALHEETLEFQDKINVYVDTHGGFRDFAMISQAIISLLDPNIAKIRGIFSVRYKDKDNKDKDNTIVDVSDGFKIFDFVSGMNELFHCGRFDSMEQFLKAPSYGYNNKTLIGCVKKVADGIQACNVSYFRKGYKELAGYFRSKRGIESVSTYFSIFENRIESDYAELLSVNPTVIDEIKWCRRKQFYQQALTLIESGMPSLLFEKNIINLTGQFNTNNLQDVFNSIVIRKIRNIRKVDELKGDWIYVQNQHEFNIKNTKRIKTVNKFLNKEIDGEINKISRKNDASDLNNGNTIKGTIIINGKSEMNHQECLDYNEWLFALLELHSLLKAVRNKSNHASDNNISVSKIGCAIESYLNICEKLGLT